MFDFEHTNALLARSWSVLRLLQRAGARPMRILIAEDEAIIAMMLADCLQDGGHEIVGPATTNAEAIMLCEGLLPDLALLDVNLPDGSNGVALARVLFDRWGLPVIFASGQWMEARQARDIAFGCIRKPYEGETVLRSVEVVRELISGGTPATMPTGFDWFPRLH